MRKLFEDKDIDAVSIATPNHWHSLATIWACQAGKDVYCEKPASYNIFEGQRMIAAAKKNNRIVQIGMQGRSVEHKQRAVQLLRDGAIGKLYMARGLCFKRRLSIGHTPDEPVPAGVNWDLFIGPAAMTPYSKNRHVYNWHWFWNTGNGDIGNQGIHQMDIARWGLGVGLPNSVVSTGGKYIYNDDQETPNTQLATLDYGDKQIVFEVRGFPSNSEGDMRRGGTDVVGNEFYGEKGVLLLDDNGFKILLGHNGQPGESMQAVKGDDSSVAHFANFVKAIKSRKPEELAGPVQEGADSMILVHLANTSYRLGRKLKFDPKTQNYVADAEANKMKTRNPYRAPYVVS
jgi:predicted dehydrogenase